MEFPRGSYHHVAMQKPQSNTTGSLEKDVLPISLQFLTLRQWRCNPYFTTCTLVSEPLIHVEFSDIKKQANDSRIKRGYENLFSEYLTMMEVPEEEHAAAIHKVFQAVEAVVDPEHPVVLHVYKCLTPCTVRDGDCSVKWRKN
ncbi:hypothetical protein ACLB2K_064582 [Fragaria x ananassa]